LVVIGDNGPFLDFSTFRKGRKRDKIWMVLYKKQGKMSKKELQKR
jgi:hypothetical protein